MTRAAALAVPVLALAACGGTATSESLEDAANETAESSSRVEVSYSMDGSRGTLSGAFDYARERAVITNFDLDDDGRRDNDVGQPTEVRSVGKIDYAAYEIDGKTYWVKESADRRSDPFSLLAPIPGGPHDPSDVFAIVLHASERIQNLGSEQVRGDEATHYRASVGLHKLAENLPAGQRDEFVEGIEREALLPVDVWIDDEDRLRRVRIREQEEGWDFEGAPDLDVTMTFELFDFGVEVDVQPPPADQLITQERLDELTGGGSAGLSDEELADLCREELPKEEAEKICDQTEARE